MVSFYNNIPTFFHLLNLKGSFAFIIIRLIAFEIPLTVLYSRGYSNSYGIFRLKLIIYKGVG